MLPFLSLSNVTTCKIKIHECLPTTTCSKDQWFGHFLFLLLQWRSSVKDPLPKNKPQLTRHPRHPGHYVSASVCAGFLAKLECMDVPNMVPVFCGWDTSRPQGQNTCKSVTCRPQPEKAREGTRMPAEPEEKAPLDKDNGKKGHEPGSGK